ncbi:MAG: amino acid ABC transporter substrate-binding protein, partial [Lachnospiraceae bacterium]
MKKLAAVLMTVCVAASLMACGSSAPAETAAPAAETAETEAPAAAEGAETEVAEGAIPNTVNTLEDLPGKTIGVQLGTTGD